VCCGALQNVVKHLRNIAERLQTTAVHCSTLAETLRKVCRPLWSFTVHAVQVVHPAVERITYSVPIVAVHYGKVTESLRTTGMLADNCSALRCITVYCGNVAEALRTIGMLPNHCGSLRRIAVQVAHVEAECTTHSWKCQNSIYLP